jgi:hypothetical protein
MRRLLRPPTGCAAVLALAAALIVVCAAASAASLTAAYCSAGATTSERPLPAALITPAAQALKTDPEGVKTGAYYRCSAGRLLVCAVGANLWCGKAETDAHPADVVAYCRSNPDAAWAPAAVTGHATIYAWRCAGGVPQLEPPSEKVDSDGYIARNWRELD